MRKLGCAGWLLVYLAIVWAYQSLAGSGVQVWAIPFWLVVVFGIWLLERGVPWVWRRMRKWRAQRARR